MALRQTYLVQTAFALYLLVTPGWQELAALLPSLGMSHLLQLFNH